MCPDPAPTPRSTLWRYGAIAFLLMVLVFGSAIVASVRWLEDWKTRPIRLVEPTEVVLERGMGLRTFSRLLEEKRLIDSALLFEVWVRIEDRYRQFQAGRYRYTEQVSPNDILTTVTSGEAYVPVAFQVTVPEGFTVRQIAERLSSLGIPNADTLLSLSTDPVVLSELRVPGRSLEGFLFPATYQFEVVPDVREIARRMVATFWERLPGDYGRRAELRGLTVTEAVALASLIELETSQDDERELVSGVIWNRLRRNMPLGIDAAIIYGIAGFDGDLTFAHLADQSNRYNLRIHGGLPPTAIGSPSLASLLAALSPADTEMLYYVVDADDFTRHRFALTLAEHNRNVRAFVNARRMRARNGTPALSGAQPTPASARRSAELVQ